MRGHRQAQVAACQDRRCAQKLQRWDHTCPVHLPGVTPDNTSSLPQKTWHLAPSLQLLDHKSVLFQATRLVAIVAELANQNIYFLRSCLHPHFCSLLLPWLSAPLSFVLFLLLIVQVYSSEGAVRASAFVGTCVFAQVVWAGQLSLQRSREQDLWLNGASAGVTHSCK